MSAFGFDADVLILGAGAAGLAAARTLCGARNVLILEGRDRIGGRILTHRELGRPPVDLGPEFIHGRPKETFDLLDEAGLIAVDIPFRQSDATDEPVHEDDAEWDEVDELVEKLSDAENEPDQSFADWLAKQNARPAVKKRAIAYIEGFNASRHDRIGVHGLIESNREEDATDGDRQHRLVGGYDQLIDALAKSVRPPSRIELNTIVRRVAWQKGRVEVTAETPSGVRTFAGPRAIITLPLSILQQPADAPTGVTFAPELPLRAALREKMVMGRVVKITLRFRERFWERVAGLDVSFVNKLDAPISVWWTKLPLRMPVLVGWAGGRRAESLPGSGRELIAVATKSLAQIFNLTEAEIAAGIIASYAHDWQSDPFSLGAYSYIGVGGRDVPKELATPLENTLFFAGEHTHTGLIGTVAGALQSGYHAAGMILGNG